MGVETGDKISDLNPLWPLGTDPVSQGDDHVRLIKGVLQNDAVSKSEDGVIDGDLTVDALAAETVNADTVNAETVNADTVNIEDDLNVTSSGFGGSFESVLTAKQSRPSKSLEQNLITSATDALAAWSGFQFEISKGDSTADTDLIASITRDGLEVTGDLEASGDLTAANIRADEISDAAGTGPIELTKQSAAKAYQFTDTDNTILLMESFNVSSIEDAGSGQLRTNYTSAFESANFIEMASAQIGLNSGSGAFIASVVTTATRTASRSRIDMYQAGAGDYGRQLSSVSYGDLA